MNESPKKAGLGRRTFYRHFQTKDELVEYITTLLMNEFSKTLLASNAHGQDMIAKCYFEFWENYIDLLLLFKKAKLLHFIGDNIEQLIIKVALQVGHIPTLPDSAPLKPSTEAMETYRKYRYEFTFKLAGFWQVTLVWCEENPRKSPEEMSQIITAFLN